jgi:hypothetical protein
VVPLMLLNLSARYTNFNKPSKVPLFASPDNSFPWRLTELSMDLCVRVGASLERPKASFKVAYRALWHISSSKQTMGVDGSEIFLSQVYRKLGEFDAFVSSSAHCCSACGCWRWV